MYAVWTVIEFDSAIGGFWYSSWFLSVLWSEYHRDLDQVDHVLLLIGPLIWFAPFLGKS